MQLFYAKNLAKESKEFTLDKTESTHIVKVLRKKQGDRIYLTNGKGLLFTAKLSLVSDRKCNVILERFIQKDKYRNYHLHIAMAPTKSHQRMEWFLEKATEIGIDEISFIVCKHSERKDLKIERLQKIAITAMKQSLQVYLPKINTIQPFEEFIKTPLQAHTYIAHCKEGNTLHFKKAFEPNKNYCVMIGAEGGFHPDEIQLAKKNNYKEINLGKQRLRTETAALLVCQLCFFVN